jgi:hypothetical protein
MTEIDIKTYKKSKLPTNPKPNSVYYILPTPSSKVIVYITDQNGVPKIIESEGAIDLSYIPSPTNGIVTSDTGTDAIIPLANNTNAGLLTPAEKTKISTALQSSDLSNLVPYTGATTNVDLGEFQLKAGQIELDQTPTGTAGVGIIRWNDEDGTIDVGLKGGNVTLQVGQEQVLRVVNKTGVNLLESEYKCVYISGAQGNRLKVDLALSNNTVNSNKTIGLVTENINNNLEGFVTTVGLVRGINTTGSLQGETWADGDVLYLSAVSAGSLTNVAPTTPNHKVVVGYIVRAHITQGSIFVKVDTGLAITELHDVNITATTANKVIGSTTEGLWENKTIAQVLEYTPANIASPVRQINSTTTLANSDVGLVIILTGSCTVTIPNGLMANFECTLVTLAGATLTLALGGSVTLLNNTGTTMAEKLSFTLKNTLTANQYLTVGNL